MNKKFMVIALLAALSTVGYGTPSIDGVVSVDLNIIDPSAGEGKVNETILKNDIDKIKNNFGDISLELADQIERQEQTEALDKK